MALFLTSRIQDGWVVMEAGGVLDSTTAGELRDSVDVVIKANRRPVRLALDLSELSYIDVDGLSILKALHTRMRERHGELHLVCPEGRVRRILQLSGLTQAVPVQPTLETVLAAPPGTAADPAGHAE
jgi:anti-anti-sigma factor